MNRRIAQLTVALLVAVVACGGPPKPRGLDRLYQGLAESLPRIDPSILAGRRILIDPGHGGHYRGTVGQDSLEESNVNLGVALYLWGLLREAGAEVQLTRAIDRDFLTQEDSSLVGDLRARTAMADTMQPDVIISIHHNAQPARDPSQNSVETYYRAGDPASLDLAFAVHRHLMRNLGIEKGEVRQGNYLVLRESKAPAVLGECGYLTHPPAEKKLKLAEAHKLEAEAYFLGLLDYFGRGIPKVRQVPPSDTFYTEVPVLVYAFADDGGPGIDPDGVSMRLNGIAVSPALDVATTRATYRLPWDTPNGAYLAEVSVRNQLGNTSPVHSTRFVVGLLPEIASFDLSPERLPRDGGVLRVRARLLDRRGLSIADGTEAVLTCSARPESVRTQVYGGTAEAVLKVAESAERLTVTVACAGRAFSKAVEPAATAAASRGLYLRDERTRFPVRNAIVETSAGSNLEMGSPSGVYVEPFSESAQHGRAGSPDSAGVLARVTAPGYRPVAIAPSSAFRAGAVDTLSLTPWFGGLLHGVRFILDPEGGPPAVSGMGELGLSGSYTNLQVARYLAGYLEAAGADVLLTRSNEEVRTREDVVRIANRYRADRYIEIRHRHAAPDSSLAFRTYHFPGSVDGKRMAASVLAAMARRLSRPAVGPLETVTYPLQQTACPAIVVEAPSIGEVAEELRLAESWYQRQQAYALFLGVLDHYGASDSGTVDVRCATGEAAEWRITLDDTWTLVTDAAGTASFERVSLGEHVVRAHKSGRTISQRVLVSPGERSRVIISPGPTE